MSPRGVVLLVLSLAFASSICVKGEVDCKKLGWEKCAFSVSSEGWRCVLEKKYSEDRRVGYECQESEIKAGKGLRECVEGHQCLKACGVDERRNVVGMSSDGLMDAHFVRRLCSPRCYSNCPNIVDLFFNLAAGEGIHLPSLCEARRTRSRKLVEKIVSSSKTSLTLSQLLQDEAAPAPAPSPS